MLFVYSSTNPCNCSTPSSPTVLEDPCNCLKFCNVTIPANSADAVAPCGGELIFNVLDPSFDHETCACGANPLTWQVAYYDDEYFSALSIAIDGEVNATTTSNAIGGTHSTVVLKATCGNLSAYLTLVVGIEDLCVNICGANEECDNCTGICEPILNIGVE